MDKKGFTLIEILAAITIIAILGVVASASVMVMMNKQKENIAKMAENNISDAAVSYYLNKKKLYMPACEKARNDSDPVEYQTFSKSDLTRITNAVGGVTEDKINSFNADMATKITIGGVKEGICYNVISVAMLEKAGMIEEGENRCNKNSIILVYSKGNNDNPEGELVSVYPDNMCIS